MRIATRTAAVLLCFAMLGIGFTTAFGETGEQSDDTVWQVVASGNKLRSVFFLDQARGWAVGANGTILATQNGGRHWTPQASSTPVDLYGVVFADERRGWAVGQTGTILKTTDGGGIWADVWARPEQKLTSAVLEAVAFSGDGKHGWAVGSEGTILKTDDGGTHWEFPRGPLPDKVKGNWFYGVASPPNESDVWVVGSKGTILLTADGGKHWLQKVDYPEDLKNTNFENVTFADGQHGWAVGDKGTILMTNDGGDTWTPQTSNTHENLYAVAFGTDMSGWAVGTNGTILATTNGGKNWEPQNTSTSKDIYGVSLWDDGNHGWAVGADGTVLSTSNIVGAWTPQTSSTSEFLDGVAFAKDGSRGWAVTATGSILGTKDGGQTWTVQRSAAPGALEELNGVAFDSDGVHGWAVGDRQDPSLPSKVQGIIIATRHGGEHWEEETWTEKDTPEALTSVAVSADGQQAWAVGYSGTILATANGGKWNKQDSGTKESLMGVAFAEDKRHGLAVGTNGAILATVNGGLDWTEQHGARRFTLRSVAFSPAEKPPHAWAIGSNGTILESRDWGSHWEPKTPRAGQLWSVAVAADNRVWAVGNEGMILTTHDDGGTWYSQTPSRSVNLKAIAVAVDGAKGWAVGGTGTTLISVKKTKPDLDSIRTEQSGSKITTSFRLRDDAELPTWDADLKVKKNGDYVPVTGSTTIRRGQDWKITWEWDQQGFKPQTTIDQEIEIHAGGFILPINVPTLTINSIEWPPWLVWLVGILLAGIGAAITKAVWPFVAVISRSAYFVALLVVAPAWLAEARPWPNGFFPKLGDWGANSMTKVLSWLCSTRKVRDACKVELFSGRKKFENFNECARPSLEKDPDVIAFLARSESSVATGN